LKEIYVIAVPVATVLVTIMTSVFMAMSASGSGGSPLATFPVTRRANSEKLEE
jgi:hypothetical protein